MIPEDILSFIPQRYPFVMIDKLLLADEKTTKTNFTVKSENIFCKNNEFEEAGLLENIAQTAAAGAGFRAKQKNKNIAVGYIAAVKNFEVFFLPKKNYELLTEVTITGNIFNATVVEGKVLCNNKLSAQCEMKIFINSND